MTAILTIDPRDMDVMEWTAPMAINLGSFGFVGQLQDPSRWQEWGANLMTMAALSGIMIPDPYQFLDWREWAIRTNQTLDNRS